MKFQQWPLAAVLTSAFLALGALPAFAEVTACVERPSNIDEQICTLVEGETASPVVVESLFDADLKVGYWTIFKSGLGNVVGNYVLFQNEDPSGNTARMISLYSPLFPAGLLDGLTELGQLQRGGNGAAVLSFDQTDVTGEFNDTFRLALLPVAVVPEPETYALMLAGLGALCLMARRNS